jgi:hypothetical protein
MLREANISSENQKTCSLCSDEHEVSTDAACVFRDFPLVDPSVVAAFWFRRKNQSVLMAWVN